MDCHETRYASSVVRHVSYGRHHDMTCLLLSWLTRRITRLPAVWCWCVDSCRLMYHRLHVSGQNITHHKSQTNNDSLESATENSLGNSSGNPPDKWRSFDKHRWKTQPRWKHHRSLSENATDNPRWFLRCRHAACNLSPPKESLYVLGLFIYSFSTRVFITVILAFVVPRCWSPARNILHIDLSRSLSRYLYIHT